MAPQTDAAPGSTMATQTKDKRGRDEAAQGGASAPQGPVRRSTRSRLRGAAVPVSAHLTRAASAPSSGMRVAARRQGASRQAVPPVPLPASTTPAASWCGDCTAVQFLYVYVEKGKTLLSLLAMKGTELEHCAGIGYCVPLYWVADGVDGPGFDNGYRYVDGRRVPEADNREFVKFEHQASRFAACNVDYGLAAPAAIRHVPTNALALPIVFSEWAAHFRANLPDADLLPPPPEWDGHTPGPHWPITAATADIGEVMDYTMMLPGSAPIRIRAPFFEQRPHICTILQLLSSILVKFKMTAHQPFGELCMTPAEFKTFVHDVTPTGPRGHHGRLGLIGQKGLFYDGEVDISAGQPLLAYPGIICKDGSPECVEADTAGSSFLLEWPPGEESYILAPDDRNVAQFANDGALNLYAKGGRNHTAAVRVNAVFVTLFIFGLPVPMLVSTRKIKPGEQIVADYGKSYKPGAR